MVPRIMSNRRFFAAMVMIIISVAAFAVYGGTFGYPFVFDDVPHLLERIQIQSLSNAFSLGEVLKNRGVVDFTFAVNYALGGREVFGYHLANVLIHILNGLVVYFLALLILRGAARVGPAAAGGDSPGPAAPLAAFFTALLFVVHPLQTQAVTYTIQRYTSMAALFYMSAILFYLKARLIQRGDGVRHAVSASPGGEKPVAEIEDAGSFTGSRNKKVRKGKKNQGQSASGTKAAAGRKPLSGGKPLAEKTQPQPPRKDRAAFPVTLFFILAALCALVAFRCKENTLSLPLAVLVVEYFAVDRTREGWKRKLPWIALGIVAAATFYLYAAGLFRPGFSWSRLLADIDRATRETDQVGRLGYLFTQFNVLVVYLRLLVFPVNQNLDYMYPFSTGFFEGTTPYAFMFLLALAIFAFWSRKRWPVLSFGVFWFFVTLSVESGVIPIRDALFEHRLYLPLFGFALSVSWAVFKVFKERINWACLALAFLVIVFGSAAFARNQVWESPVRLWSDVIRKNPQSIRGHTNLANALSDAGRYRDAAAHYRYSLTINPTSGDAITYYNLGNALKKMGNPEEAESAYRKAIELDPRHSEAFNNLGRIFQERGDLHRAEAYFLKAVSLSRYNVEPRNNLAMIYVNRGAFDEAARQYAGILEFDRDNVTALNNMANCLILAGKTEEGAAQYGKALALRPEDPKLHYNLAMALSRLGRTGEAESHLKEAERLHPAYGGRVNYALAEIYARQSRTEEAMEYLEKALDRGFKDTDMLEKDETFRELRELERFRLLIRGEH